jgi:hypothetical protein
LAPKTNFVNFDEVFSSTKSPPLSQTLSTLLGRRTCKRQSHFLKATVRRRISPDDKEFSALRKQRRGHYFSPPAKHIHHRSPVYLHKQIHQRKGIFKLFLVNEKQFFPFTSSPRCPPLYCRKRWQTTIQICFRRSPPLCPANSDVYRWQGMEEGALFEFQTMELNFKFIFHSCLRSSDGPPHIWTKLSDVNFRAPTPSNAAAIPFLFNLFRSKRIKLWLFAAFFLIFIFCVFNSFVPQYTVNLDFAHPRLL